MSGVRCEAPLPRELLSDYWLGDIAPEEEASVEEHFLGCDRCSGRLRWLIDLAGATRGLARRGLLRIVVSAAFLEQLAGEGLVVREYRVPPGGSVACTVTPEDDLVVARLVAPFETPARTDVVVCDAQGLEQLRLTDIAVDSTRGEVALIEPIDALRALAVSTARIRLVAVEDRGERILGEYTFNHTPHIRP